MASARAQSSGPVALDPNIARQGTALVLALDGTALSPDGQAPTSITVAMPTRHGRERDARKQLCSRAQAARGTCPPASRIGFGRYVVDRRRLPGARRPDRSSPGRSTHFSRREPSRAMSRRLCLLLLVSNMLSQQ